MRSRIDKRLRAQQFRVRLDQALTDRGLSQSALAREIGVDRSTVSQLLKGDGARLPNAQVVGACASVLGVSSDWLLSLSDRPETAAGLLDYAFSLTAAPRALVDDQIFAWHREAAGYKIRHVPAALPDMLKTNNFLEWEYTPHLGKTTSQAIGASQDRLTWMQNSHSDYEICIPRHELISFARAQGYYSGLPARNRLEQIDHLLDLTRALYPRLRVYLYDARRVFSSPITVFGPLMAVLYAGHHYLVFRDAERVAALTEHFDNLVREAAVSARDLPEELGKLRDEIAQGSD